MKALQMAMLASFEARAIDHLLKFFPDRFAENGTESAGALVRRTLAKGEKYGIRGQRQVVQLLDTMVLLGEDFDENPRLAWSRKILEDRETPARHRMDEIWRRLKDHLKGTEPNQ